MIIKDIKILLSDRKAIFIFILMPIVLTTILSFALKGSFSSESMTSAIPIAVVKEYELNADVNDFQTLTNQWSTEPVDPENLFNPESTFFEDFLGNSQLKSVITYKVMSMEEANQALKDKSIYAVVILPKHFVYDQYVNLMMPNRNKIQVKVLTHPDYNYSGKVVRQIMTSYFDKLNERIVAKNTYLTYAIDHMSVGQVIESISPIINEEIINQPVEKIGVTGTKVIDSFTYYSIAMMAMFVLYSAGNAGKEMLREKRKITLDRNRSIGVSMTHMMLSKSLMTFLLTGFQMTVLLIFARFVLKVDWQFSLQLLVGIFFSAFAISGIGSFLGALTLATDNFRVANIFQNLLIHVFALIGGSYLPMNVLPDAVNKVSFLAVNRSILDLFLATYQARPITSSLLALGIIGMIFILAGWVIIKRQEGQLYVDTYKA